MNLKTLSNLELTENLTRVVRREREVISDVVSHVHEFMTRKLYFDHGCTSIFQYLVEKQGYAKATAMNRIDAARLLDAVPELENDLRSGEINLTQISTLAQGLRQFRKERPDEVFDSEKKAELISKIRNLDGDKTAVTVAQALDLSLKEIEKTRHQKDRSVVLEVTLSEAQFELLKRAKDLSSHVQHDANWADVIGLLACDYVKRKDLTIQKPERKAEPKATKEMPQKTEAKNDLLALDKTETVESSLESSNGRTGSDPNRAVRKAIPISIKRRVASKSGGHCEYVDKETGEICGSTYQLQFDHVLSVTKGGGNEESNLQMLCGIHNRLKYQREG